MNIPQTMKAMVLEGPGVSLEYKDVPVPTYSDEQLLIKVNACGVCRTDLHIVDGDLTDPKIPLIPGHEIVGTVVAVGRNVRKFKVGERVGVPWLGYTCGKCQFCKKGKENLCENPLFTGYTMDGGYAQYAAAYQYYCFKLPESYSDTEVAPLLCAGLIGYRSYRKIREDFENLGIYGFGAAAHIITQIAVHEGKKVFAFTRKGDKKAQELALGLGSFWAGASQESPPEKLDASIIFAPVGELVPAALKETVPGGIVVCGGIYMSDIPSFSYSLLWEERAVCSVANLTREDGEGLFQIVPMVPVKTKVLTYPLKEANKALDDLRNGKIEGAAVLDCSGEV